MAQLDTQTRIAVNVSIVLQVISPASLEPGPSLPLAGDGTSAYIVPPLAEDCIGEAGKVRLVS